ncbi:MAG: hypothetical protein K2X08_05395 [Chlamydiales bacterium]|nr:hypothetical protein [Chlamydiales bacterium]
MKIIIAKLEEDGDFLRDIDYEITKSMTDWFEIMLPTFNENRSLMNLPFSKMNGLKARILACAQEVDPDIEESDAKKKATESTPKNIEESESTHSGDTVGE